MESEASSRSSASPSPHQLSTINASTTDDKRSGGKKRRRQPLNVGVQRRKRSEMAHDAVNVVHGDAATSSHAAAESTSRKKVNVFVESGGGREVEFVDEEAIFNMPLLMDCMAEGMLLTPPALKTGFCWTQDVDDHLHSPLFHS